MAKYDPITGDLLPEPSAKNNGNERKSVPETPESPLSAFDMALLDGMSQQQLIALINRVCVAGWGYGDLTGRDLIAAALSTKEEAYEALKLRAFCLASNASEWREFHALATFWAEREKGKPKQSIDTTVTLSILDLVEEATRKRREKMIDVTPK